MVDHVCDAFASTLVSTATWVSLGMSREWAPAFFVASSFGFYAVSLEEYHTGVLDLGYISGAVEGLVLVVVEHSVTAMWGVQVWATPLSQLMPFLPEQVGQFSVRWVQVVALGILSTWHAIESSRNIFTATRASGKSSGFVETVVAQAQVYYAAALTCVWWYSTIGTVAGGWIILSFTFLFGNMATRLIVARMCRWQVPMFNSLLPSLTIVAAHALATKLWFPEGDLVTDVRTMAVGYAVLAFSSTWWIVHKYVTEMGEYLGVPIYSVPPRAQALALKTYVDEGANTGGSYQHSKKDEPVTSPRGRRNGTKKTK